MTEKTNIKLNEGFVQVCVWPGCVLKPDQISDFEDWMLSELKTRVQYLESIVIKSGKREDVIFAVHGEDIGKMAVARIPYGMRWLEDIYGNGQGNWYPKRFEQYQCW